MDRPTNDEVLEDAYMLAMYAFRRGVLPNDSTIFGLINEAEHAKMQGSALAHAPLLAELERVSRAAGVTILQLRRRETPVGRLRYRAALLTPFLVGFLTLLLTLYLAFQSSELRKADLALREYQDLVGERLQEKIHLAWKLYYYQFVIGNKEPDQRHLDDYQKLVDDAKRLAEKRDAVNRLLWDSSQMRYLPELFQLYGPCWTQEIAATLNAADPKFGVSEACRPMATESDSSKPLESLGTSSKGCDDVGPRPPSATDPAPANLSLSDYTLSVACFVWKLGIGSYDLPVSKQIYLVRDKVNLLVSWLLPGLYGLLGACVFLMRDLLQSNGTYKAESDKRIVDLLSLVLRIALGGLAGIIIGWFWVPSGPGSNSSPIPVSSVSFGLAFLAGFSIDILFSLLDRLNKSIGQSGRSDSTLDKGTRAAGTGPAP